MFFSNQLYREAAALVARTAPSATTIVEFTLLCAIAFASGALLAFSF